MLVNCILISQTIKSTIAMSKENLIFKLDNLEYQIHYLRDTLDSFHPRLPYTSKMYNVKGRKNLKRLQSKMAGLDESTLEKEAEELKILILNQKIHNAEKQLAKVFQGHLKEPMAEKMANCAAATDSDGFISNVIISKLVKLTRQRVMCLVKTQELDGIPTWYQHHLFENIWNDKKDHRNPSFVWNEMVQKTDGAAGFISSTMNDPRAKDLIAGFEKGVNLALGLEVKPRVKAEEKAPVEDEKEEAENDSNDDDDADSDLSIEDDIVPDQDIDEDTLKQYDALLADSDEEEADGNAGTLNDGINYNEVTDEEPSASESESDSDDDSNNTASKYNLPELMNGYYSGDEEAASDLDSEEEAQVRAQTELPKKKNRRGQRARRRIWAQKYGREANHVQREIEEHKAEREKRQREWEEREAKRQAKQVKYNKTNANLIPIANAKKMGEGVAAAPAVALAPQTAANENHPSWVAKKQAEEKLKNAKFAGKKITFD